MGCIVFSIKTAKQREAERFALGLYEDLYIHVKQGGSVNSKTFRQVFSEWAEATEKMAPTRQGGQTLLTLSLTLDLATIGDVHSLVRI
jgi:hypothetical protein